MLPISLSRIKAQGGWLMPVAAFIIVVMGLLAAGMARVGSQTSIAGAQEQVSLQAFYVAETGAQYAMSRLFYHSTDPVTRTTATNACAAIDGSSLNLNAAGMRECSTALACEVSTDVSDSVSFYQVRSTGQCGVAPVSAQRTVKVSTYLR